MKRLGDQQGKNQTLGGGDVLSGTLTSLLTGSAVSSPLVAFARRVKPSAASAPVTRTPRGPRFPEDL